MFNIFKSITQSNTILKGLKVEKSNHPWRCNNCSKLQRLNSNQVWMPWSGMTMFSYFDSKKDIKNYTIDCLKNGSRSYNAWCEKCAPKE